MPLPVSVIVRPTELFVLSVSIAMRPPSEVASREFLKRFKMATFRRFFCALMRSGSGERVSENRTSFIPASLANTGSTSLTMALISS